ncbi:hypothetical protein [Micromonospora sp. NPDC023814]|uniref:DUF7662 domain-containing protein n=1 Tax=Micromonospora sp. NPDC023814 TaxID=3154596 RepID=UPI0033F7E11E
MSKYDALRDMLRRHNGEVRYTFAELDDIVPGGLPPSAYRYEAWWSNGDRTHAQCRAWGDAGYDAHPDIAGRQIRFTPER